MSRSVLGFSEVASSLGVTAAYRVSAETESELVTNAASGLLPIMNAQGGMAAGDIDADSDVDVVVLRGDARPHVYLSSVSDSSAEAQFVESGSDLGLDLDPWATSPVLADLVGDSKPDLLVAGFGGRFLALYENHWPDAFEDVTEAVGLSSDVPSVGLTVGDVDNDGDLDVVVAHVVSPPDSNAPYSGVGALWINEDKQRFTDASSKFSAAGVASAAEEGTLTPNLVDIDSDGDQDLVLVGAPGFTRILINTLIGGAPASPPSNVDAGHVDASHADGGASGRDASPQSTVSTDADVTADIDAALGFGLDAAPLQLSGGDAGAGPEAFAFVALGGVDSATNLGGRGTAFADYDHDGDLDWFISGGASSGDLSSKLLTNQDNDTFVDDSDDAQIDARGFGLGSCSEDFNNDGLMDFFQVADAEYLTSEDERAGAKSADSRAALYIADISAPGTFDEVGSTWGFDSVRHGRAVLCFDYDKDGDVDILVSAADEPVRLFRNSLNPVDGSGANYFEVRLEFQGANLAAVGARVSFTTGAVTQTRTIRHHNGLFGSGAAVAHFGLGAEPVVSSFRIDWPNGETAIENQAFLPNDVARIRYRGAD